MPQYFGDFRNELYLAELSGKMPLMLVDFATWKERAQEAMSSSVWNHGGLQANGGIAAIWKITNLVVRIIGPLFGLTQEYMTNHLGIRFALDNIRTRQELCIVYRPFEQTMADQCRGWALQHRAKAA